MLRNLTIFWPEEQTEWRDEWFPTLGKRSRFGDFRSDLHISYSSNSRLKGLAWMVDRWNFSFAGWESARWDFCQLLLWWISWRSWSGYGGVDDSCIHLWLCISCWLSVQCRYRLRRGVDRCCVCHYKLLTGTLWTLIQLLASFCDGSVLVHSRKQMMSTFEHLDESFQTPL